MFTLFLGVALAIGATAQSTPEFVCKKFQNAPIIDGTKDAIWDNASCIKYVVDANDTAGYADPTINECYFKMGWNDTALFILVYRNDDDFFSEFEPEAIASTLGDWKTDRDELFFDVFADTLNDGRGAQSPNGASFGHYQFTSKWLKKGAEATANDTIWWPQQWYHNAPFQLGTKFQGPNAYFCEYAILLTSLKINPTFIPSVGTDTCPLTKGDGTIFGFSISVNDVDLSDAPTSEAFRKYLRWEPTLGVDPWGNSDGLAVFVLSDTLITGVNNNKISNNAVVYPSQATNSIMLGSDVADLRIYDAAGKLVVNMKNVKANTEVDVRLLNSGVYFVNADGLSGKFVK
jgi:hypothetical protein